MHDLGWISTTTRLASETQEDGPHGVGWMLFAFVLTFAVTRLITRLIRAGKGPFRNMVVGQVHVHHQVYGIFLMLIAGALEFAYEPGGVWRQVLAGLFGMGAALTLDEFALLVHLDDVYWSKDGRKSVDAVLITAAMGVLLFVGANPLGLGDAESKPVAAVIVMFNLAFALCALAKGKVATGLIGVFVPFVAMVSAMRIAKPDSPWARWRYKEGPGRTSPHADTMLARSLRRFPPDRRTWWDHTKDFLAGAPSR
ncbi:hypothetical protein [Embleya sp. NBC_00896]|uniref:hypothetical protein n=1 Tax=Embleya sp. NBC_00896 TaxID=2975961 RepID=UPI00386EC230|nr:hypothetical protein OG928_18770 [Embleya sp. NBC_00896]